MPSAGGLYLDPNSADEPDHSTEVHKLLTGRKLQLLQS